MKCDKQGKEKTRVAPKYMGVLPNVLVWNSKVRSEQDCDSTIQTCSDAIVRARNSSSNRDEGDNEDGVESLLDRYDRVVKARNAAASKAENHNRFRSLSGQSGPNLDQRRAAVPRKRKIPAGGDNGVTDKVQHQGIGLELHMRTENNSPAGPVISPRKEHDSSGGVQGGVAEETVLPAGAGESVSKGSEKKREDGRAIGRKFRPLGRKRSAAEQTDGRTIPATAKEKRRVVNNEKPSGKKKEDGRAIGRRFRPLGRKRSAAERTDGRTISATAKEKRRVVDDEKPSGAVSFEGTARDMYFAGSRHPSRRRRVCERERAVRRWEPDGADRDDVGRTDVESGRAKKRGGRIRVGSATGSAAVTPSDHDVGPDSESCVAASKFGRGSLSPSANDGDVARRTESAWNLHETKRWGNVAIKRKPRREDHSKEPVGVTKRNNAHDDVPGCSKDWSDKFEELVDFKAKYGHCNVPRNNPELRKWVTTQRSMYRGVWSKEFRERIPLLEKIGFQWDGGRSSGETVLCALDDSDATVGARDGSVREADLPEDASGELAGINGVEQSVPCGEDSIPVQTDDNIRKHVCASAEPGQHDVALGLGATAEPESTKADLEEKMLQLEMQNFLLQEKIAASDAKHEEEIHGVATKLEEKYKSEMEQQKLEMDERHGRNMERQQSAHSRELKSLNEQLDSLRKGLDASTSQDVFNNSEGSTVSEPKRRKTETPNGKAPRELCEKQKESPWRSHLSVPHAKRGKCSFVDCPGLKLGHKRDRGFGTIYHCEECTAGSDSTVYLCHTIKSDGTPVLCHQLYHDSLHSA